MVGKGHRQDGSPSSSSPPHRPTVAARTRTRKPGEVRSRSGCLTCKQRRKKCDEDFRLRANGQMACTRCADRHIDCELSNPAPSSQPSRHSPYPSAARQDQLPHNHRFVSNAPSAASRPSIEPNVAIGAALDPTQPWTSAQINMHLPSNQQAMPGSAYLNQASWHHQSFAGQSRPTNRYNRQTAWPASMLANPAGFDALNPSPSVLGNPGHAIADAGALYNVTNSSALPYIPTPTVPQWSQSYTNSVDNVMLDDFVNELMSLTGPLGGPSVTPAPSINDTPPIEQSIPTTPVSLVGPSASQSLPDRSTRRGRMPATRQSASTGRRQQPSSSSQQYQNLLASDAIESLLSKYSPIYEHFWHATLLVLSSKRRQAAVDYLMGVIRSNKACRASVVVVCLAYHELVQRVRKEAVRTNATEARDPSKAANWTTLASESFKEHHPSDQEILPHPILTMFPDEMDQQSERPSRSAPSPGLEPDHDDITRNGRQRSMPLPRGYSSNLKTASSSRSSSKVQALSGVGDENQESGDSGEDASEGGKVQDLAVELWFDIAKAELERSRSDLSLEQEICAIINLRWACLCFAGAERTRRMTEELRRVIQRSGLDLEHMVEDEKNGSMVSIMLQTAVYTDILDAACERGKRASVPLMSPNNQQPRSSSAHRSNAAGSDDTTFSGKVSLLSLELLTCFKMISDLAADIWGPTQDISGDEARPTDDQVAVRSRDLERKIMSLPAWSDPHTSSSLRVRAFALQEIWRQTARLYLLQSVHRRGPLHPELQTILHEIIRLAKMIKIQAFPPHMPAPNAAHDMQCTGPSKYGTKTSADYVGGLGSSAGDYARSAFSQETPVDDGERSETVTDSDTGGPSASTTATGRAAFHPFQMWLDVASWEMCTVWFLCSTVAVTSEDRQFCIHHLDSLGLERANRDNVQVIRDFWAKQDETGHSLDWFEFVQASNRCIVFAF